MSIGARVLILFTIFASGCAALQSGDPLEVTVAGIEPLPGQGMELRMLVKLRVQNPNDASIAYNGVALQMSVQNRTFATGVSDESGSVPRFGETVIAVPVTISAFNMVRQAMGMASGQALSKVTYEMKGKLNGPTFSSKRFVASGEFELPTGARSPTS